MTDSPGTYEHLPDEWRPVGRWEDQPEPVYQWVRDKPRTRWGMVLLWLWTGVAVTAAAWAIINTTGCSFFGGLDALPSGDKPSLPPATIWTDPRAMLGLLGGLCAVGAVALTVAAFTPFGRLIPKGAALGALAAAIGCWVVQRYFGAIMWVALATGIVAAVAFAVPMYGTLKHWTLARLSNRLDAKHPDAAGALLAVARGVTGESKRAKEKRRKALGLPTGGNP